MSAASNFGVTISTENL